MSLNTNQLKRINKDSSKTSREDIMLHIDHLVYKARIRLYELIKREGSMSMNIEGTYRNVPYKCTNTWLTIVKLYVPPVQYLLEGKHYIKLCIPDIGSSSTIELSIVGVIKAAHITDMRARFFRAIADKNIGYYTTLTYTGLLWIWNTFSITMNPQAIIYAR